MLELIYLPPDHDHTFAAQCPNCGAWLEAKGLQSYSGFWDATIRVWRNHHIITTESLTTELKYHPSQIRRIMTQRFEKSGLVKRIGKRGGWVIPDTIAL